MYIYLFLIYKKHNIYQSVIVVQMIELHWHSVSSHTTCVISLISLHQVVKLETAGKNVISRSGWTDGHSISIAHNGNSSRFSPTDIHRTHSRNCCIHNTVNILKTPYHNSCYGTWWIERDDRSRSYIYILKSSKIHA